MHASIWRFAGDPDELAAAYDAMLAAMPTTQSMRLHACLKTPDGLLMFDTCPSEEVFRGFVAGGVLEQMRAAGLPDPEIDDYPVHAAFIDGQRDG